MPNPLEKSATYYVRLDLRKIATLHRHLSKLENFPTISGMNRKIIDHICGQIVDNGAIPFETVAEARNYLESEGLLGSLKSKPIVKAMQHENITLDGMNPDYMKRKNQFTPDQYKAARAALRKIQDDELSGVIAGPTPGTVKTVKSVER